MQKNFWVAFALTAWGLSPVFAEEIAIKTKRGADVPTLIDMPEGPGPHPAVLLAPGADYQMIRPILAKTAEALVRNGFAVYRMDWAYTPTKGKPSQGFVNEKEDMLAVLEHAKNNPAIRKDQITVGGKSIGSVVAWQIFSQSPEISGAILLTPLCSAPASNPKPPAENYEKATNEIRPTLWISGDRDPLCSTNVLYKFIAEVGGSARVNIVNGKHGFEPAESGLKDDAAETQRTASLAGELAADFASTIRRRSTAK